MRAQRAQGRPGTAVFPPSWSASHGVVAAKTMTAVVNLRKPGTTKTWSDELEQNVPVKNTAYAEDQAARVQAQRRVARHEIEAAEETLHVAGYLVTLTFDRDVAEEPAVADLIDVTASDDPLLTGHTLRVLEVVHGSLRFERDLFCTLDS